MPYILFSIYGFIIITFVILYFFIVYHLTKYSINARVNKIMIPFFIAVSTLLLFSNIMLFFSVDWNNLISRVF